MMRGSAVPTIVWSIAARSAASSRPVSVPISCGRVRRTTPEVAYCVSEVVVVIGSTALPAVHHINHPARFETDNACAIVRASRAAREAPADAHRRPEQSRHFRARYADANSRLLARGDVTRQGPRFGGDPPGLDEHRRT